MDKKNIVFKIKSSSNDLILLAPTIEGILKRYNLAEHEVDIKVRQDKNSNLYIITISKKSKKDIFEGNVSEDLEILKENVSNGE